MLDNLNHAFTPLFLRKLNTDLAKYLAIEERNESEDKLVRLMALRHRLVVRELKRLPASTLSSFAENELNVNRYLDKVVRDFQSQVKKEIVGFTRAQKAAKSYK
jgi:hypothetical protein